MVWQQCHRSRRESISSPATCLPFLLQCLLDYLVSHNSSWQCSTMTVIFFGIVINETRNVKCLHFRSSIQLSGLFAPSRFEEHDLSPNNSSYVPFWILLSTAQFTSQSWFPSFTSSRISHSLSPDNLFASNGTISIDGSVPSHGITHNALSFSSFYLPQLPSSSSASASRSSSSFSSHSPYSTSSSTSSSPC